MKSNLVLTLSALVLLSQGFVTVAAAQPLGTDLFVCHGHLSRMTRGGAVTTLVPGGFNDASDVMMDADNRHLVALLKAGTSRFHVCRVDPALPGIVATVFSAAPGESLRAIRMDQDGDYLVSRTAPPALLKVKRDGSGATTLFARSTGTTTAVSEDTATGDFLVRWFDAGRVKFLRVDRDTGRPITLFTFAGGAAGYAQDPHRTDVYMAEANNGSLMRIDLDTRKVTTISLYRFRLPISVAVDRAPAANGALVYVGGWNRVYAVSRSGVTLGTIGSANPVNGLTLDASRNLAAELSAAPNRRTLHVNFPASAGKRYLVALGLTGYAPGVRLADGRVIPINPDLLTATTVLSSLGPLLVDNRGVLSASGRAAATFDANPLGSAVNGLRVWAVALTLDAAAPTGIGEISAPLVLVL